MSIAEFGLRPQDSFTSFLPKMDIRQPLVYGSANETTFHKRGGRDAGRPRRDFESATRSWPGRTSATISKGCWQTAN